MYSPGVHIKVVCHILFQSLFPTQETNPCLLHWQADSLPLSHQASPNPPLEHCDVPGCASLILTAESRQVTPCRPARTQCDHRQPPTPPPPADRNLGPPPAQSLSDGHNIAAFLHAPPGFSPVQRERSWKTAFLLWPVSAGRGRAGGRPSSLVPVSVSCRPAAPSSGSPRRGPGAGGEQGRGSNGGATWRRPRRAHRLQPSA